MEEKEIIIDAEQARAFIAEKFRAQGDFSIIEEKTFEEMLDRVIALDEEFMTVSGVDDGGVYDDDAAYEFMHEKMMAAFPEHKMYMMRFVEDYMEYNEQYMDEAGLIDWE